MNKIIYKMLCFIIIFGLVGCGNAVSTMNDEELEENREVIPETMDETGIDIDDEDIADVISDPSTADVVDEVVESSSLSENTVSTPIPVVEEESEPEPHVHQYVESITVQPTCAVAGEKTLTCECGDVRTEAIPATGNHSWDALAIIVHHDEIGHMEQTQVQVGWTEARTEYECPICGYRADTPKGISDHQFETTLANGFVFQFDENGYPLGYENDPVNGEKLHMGNTWAWDYPAEPIYETQSKWVVDQEGFDMLVITSYTCSTCGLTEQLNVTDEVISISEMDGSVTNCPVYLDEEGRKYYMYLGYEVYMHD